jgi:hypothetical protein
MTTNRRDANTQLADKGRIFLPSKKASLPKKLYISKQMY